LTASQIGNEVQDEEDLFILNRPPFNRLLKNRA